MIKQAVSKRDKLHAESDKLLAEGSRLLAEGSRLHAEGSRLHAEGSRLHAEGDKLYTEGNLKVINAVIKEHGPEAEITFDNDKVTVELNTKVTY